jgi:hypothetical protein
MSLLKKASIITTPTAYAEDYLYSVKPALKVSDTEIITNGDFSNGLTNWTASTSPPTLNADNTVTFDSSTEFIFQSISKTVGRRYRLTFDGTGNLRYRTGFAGTDAPTKEIVLPAVIDIVATSDTNRVQPYGSTLGTGILKSISLKEITDADFDFTRNSTGTRVNEDYLIEDVPYNLLPQSNTFETTWQLVNATLNDGYYGVPKSYDAWLLTKSAANGRLNQFTSISSQTHTYSVYAKANDSSWMKLQVFDGSSFYFTTFNLSNGSIGTDSNLISSSIEGVRDGWYRCSIQFSAAITVAYIYPADGDNDTSGASGSIYIQNAQIVKGDQPKDYLKTTDRLDIPRIDYTNGEPSILLEPQRQNKVTYSNDFTQWNNISTTLTANYGLSPDGTNNATRLQRSAGVRGVIYNGTSVTSGQSYTISLYVKSLNSTQQIRIGADNGCVNPQGAETFTVGEKWQRISTTITASQTSWNYFIDNVQSGIGCTGTYVGVDILIYGFQVEEGSYATSLIHTSGSAVTRSADVANNAGNSDLINSTEGVLYAEIKALDEAQSVTALSISDSSLSNRVLIALTGGELRGQFISSANNINKDTSGVTIEEFNKIACSYTSTTFKVFVNGNQLGTTSTSLTAVTGLKELTFDRGDGGIDLNGNAKMVAVFKEALSDTELEKLTGYNNHELYMNYYNRLSYLGLVEEYNVESDINNYIL